MALSLKLTPHMTVEAVKLEAGQHQSGAAMRNCNCGLDATTWCRDLGYPHFNAEAGV
jgi:hypothetical protein